ncbi:hypothetical protein DSO57_1036491 [Entomophthora muscae]|uniref:Uncharacterized protein n=1 Tax=Entomophthora muscae TaxID=34485 RepID=A0ACC2U8V5_9FUNG|nr:hypothetical protein DSO57_1036491 [Entomophthora muscae]
MFHSTIRIRLLISHIFNTAYTSPDGSTMSSRRGIGRPRVGRANLASQICAVSDLQLHGSKTHDSSKSALELSGGGGYRLRRLGARGRPPHLPEGSVEPPGEGGSTVRGEGGPASTGPPSALSGSSTTRLPAENGYRHRSRNLMAATALSRSTISLRSLLQPHSP